MFREIAVLYPRGGQTGGPEALHQLVDSLRQAGLDAYLVPLNGFEGAERVAAYSRYDAPERPSAPDVETTAVVVPEVYTGDAVRFRRATVFTWWLSINNVVVEGLAISKLEHDLGMRGEMLPRHHHIGTTWKAKRERRREDRQRVAPNEDLAQSQYAWSHRYAAVRRPPSLISDYTPAPDELAAAAVPARNRRRAVCFNPKKSGQLARGVAALMPDVAFVPIENMSRAEVVRTLGECAVYLDLGSHPGKDRIPREAALAGAVVVCALRGSAAFHSDVPIPLQHKVPFDENVVTSARGVVADVLAGLDQASALQDPYREVIRREREVFDAQVFAVFVLGLRGFDAVFPILDEVARLRNTTAPGR